MNATRIIMTCTVLLCCAGLARGTVVSVDLPELVGYYDLSTDNTMVSVDLGTTFDSINEVSLRLVGTAWPGLAYDHNLHPGYFDVSVGFTTYMYPDSGGGYAYTASHLGDGLFDIQDDFEQGLDTTWDFLLDGTTEIDVIGPAFLSVGWITLIEDPSCTIDQATLIVSGVAAGDTDMDYDVDGADLAAIGVNWAPASTDKVWADGDFDADGDVDGSDLAGLGLNWNPVQQIPEPVSLCMIAIPGVVLSARRRRGRTGV